jgi:2-C-methyl-D-erythritol 2,4-cyclodiphosphate synthase
VNVDATVIAERPKLTPHFAQMRSKISAVLGLPEERVGLKATTSEGMGALGRGEGIGALAVCLIERS